MRHIADIRICAHCANMISSVQKWHMMREERKGKERKGKERKGKGREGKERKGKERKGKERKGKERKEKKRKRKENSTPFGVNSTRSLVMPST